MTELQTLIDAFVEEYNQRPHRSLEHRATPATVDTTRPRPPTGNQGDDTHDRFRYDRAGKIIWRYRGEMYPIGIGRTHTGTRVIVLSQ